MTAIISARSSVQRQLKRAQLRGILFLILSVLVIGYLSLLNVQKGFREYHHLSQQTMPVINLLEGLKFSSMRIVASVSELGMIALLEGVAEAEKNAAKAKEDSDLEQGFHQFNLKLYRYLELVRRYFPLEVADAERLFHAGDQFRRQAKQLLAAIEEEAEHQELLQLSQAMEQSEGAFLVLATKILQSEAEEVSERNEVITHALERQIWVLCLGGLFIVGLAIFQRRLRMRLCLSCSGAMNATEKTDSCSPTHKTRYLCVDRNLFRQGCCRCQTWL